MNTIKPTEIFGPIDISDAEFKSAADALAPARDAMCPPDEVKVIVVDNPFTPEKHLIFYHKLSDGNTVRELIPDTANPDTLVVSLNGGIVQKEDWATTKLNSQDSIVLVQAPAGGDAKDIFRIILLIVVVVFAGWAAPELATAMGFAEAGGVAIAIEVGIAVVGAALVMALLPPVIDMPNSGDMDSSPTYGIDGAKNTQEEGVPMPVVYGGFRMGGNVINISVRNIGETQYLYMLINAGEGPIAGITEIELNEQPIENFQDAESEIRLGTSDQSVMEWFQDTITPQSVGVTLTTSYQTRTTGVIDRFRVDLVAPQGLCRFNDDGSRSTITVNFDIQYRLSGSADPWVSLQHFGAVTGYNATYVYYGYENYDADGNLLGTVSSSTSATLGPGQTLVGGRILDGDANVVGYRDGIGRNNNAHDLFPHMSGKQTSALRQSWWSPLLPQGVYDVRVMRLTADSTNEKILDTVIWSDLNDIINDDVAYRHTALLGLKIRLSDQLSRVPKVTFRNEGRIIKARTSNGNWLQTPSNNPAWVAWDMLTNTRYGAGLSETRLDKERFIEWSDFCESTGLQFNGIFDTNMSMWDSLTHVFRAGHARPLRMGTKYSVAIDKPTAPSQMFSSGNIIKGSFSQKWLSLQDRANEVDISYFDENDRHKRRTIKVYDDSVAAGAPQNTASATLYGITKPDRALEEAIFLLKSNRLMRKTVNFRAPLEAVALTVGDVFLLQHEQPQIAMGGRLGPGSTATNIVLDREVTLSGAETYKIIVRHNKQDKYIATATAVTVGIRRITLGLGYNQETDVNRVTNGTVEAGIVRFDPNINAVYVDDITGFAVNDTITLFQTDEMEEATVTPGTSGTVTSVPLQNALQQAPAEYQPWLMGPIATVNSLWRCVKVEIDSDYTVSIAGAEYNPEIYNWAPTTGAVVAPDSNYSTVVPHVTNLSAGLSDTLIGNVLRPVVDVSWDLPTDFEDYGGAEIQFAIDGGAYQTVGLVTDGSTFFQKEVQVGMNITVRVVAMSADNRFALRSTAPTVAIVITNNVYAPAAPTAFQVATAQAGLTLSWTNPIDADFGGCEIKRNTANDEPGATLIYITERRTIQYSDLGADNGGNTYFYWIRSFDTDGNFSAWTPSTPASATPVTIASGTDATTGFLTNEAHIIPAAADGSSPVFTGANGIFKTFKGLTENSPTTTFSVLGADNATVTINTAAGTPVAGQPVGYYQVTGETVAQDVHSINLRGVTSDGITIDKVFTITKSKAGANGADGATAKLVKLGATTQAFSYNNATGTPVLIGPASIVFSVTEQNTTGVTTWQAFDSTGAEILPVSTVLSSMTDSGATMLETAFAAQTNNTFIRVRATREGISDDFSVFELLSGADGADGLTAKTVQIEAPSQVFAYDNATGTPALIGPTQITFNLNRQNISGATSWTLVDSIGGDQTASLSGATNTQVTLTEAAFAAITNNSFVKLTATADGISDSVTIVELISGQDGAEGTPGAPGTPAHSGFLTNEAHVVGAATDGTGYSLVGSGGTFKVFEGTTDVTASTIFNITGGVDNGTNWTKVQNGLTLTLQETTGVYDLTGGSWTSDQESFTMTATHNGVTITKVYTITKSKQGATGPNGAASSSVSLSSTAITFAYDNSTGTPVLIGPSQIDFTLNRQNIIGATTWSLVDSLGGDQTAKLTGTGNTARTLTAANFATITNNEWVKLTATADGLSDTVTVAKLVSGQDGAPGNNGTNGENAISGYLTNETHNVTAATDGTGYSLTGAGGTFKVFNGITDVTTSTLFSIIGGVDAGTTWNKTQNGLTLTLNETSGIYSLSGASWTTDQEQFTLEGVFGGVTIQKVYVITKSKAGAQGNTGNAGADAKLIKVTADAMAFTYDGTGAASPGSQTITLTSVRQNIATATNWVTSPVVTLGGTGDTRTLAIADFGANTSVEITASSEGFQDKVTIVRIQDGAAGAPGSNGSNGVNAISGYLTNETHLVAALNDGTGYVLTGSGGTFAVFNGITDVTTSAIFSIIGGTDLGATWEKTQNGLTMTMNETLGTYVLSGGSWTSDEEQFTLQAVYGGVTLQKIYVITKSKTGGTGAPGSPGAAAKSISLSSDAQAFTYDGTGAASPGSQTITFTANRQNIASATTFTTSPVVTLSGTGDTRTLSLAQFGANTAVTVTASAEGLEDKITVVRIQDGATGSPGGPGTNAHVGLLTNESHTVPTLADGTGYSLTNAGGTFKVWDGTTDVTTSSLFSIVGGVDNGTNWTLAQNGLTMTIQETTGVYTLSGGSWTTTAEAFVLRATHGGVTIDRQYVITKAIAGTQGNTGPQGAAGRDGIVVAAVRPNNNTFSGTLSGSMYVHGLDANGNPADVNGTAFYDGTLITVPKQHVDTSQHLGTAITGYLVLDRSGANFTVNAVGVQIAAVWISNPSAGVQQWQYDNGAAWTNFTPTQNHLIIGFYTTSAANVIDQATITAPLPMSTATITAAQIKTTTLSAMAATIGTVETRANTGGVGNTTPRLVLSNSGQPMKIFDTDDVSRLFGLTDTGSGLELYLKGNFALNSLSSFSGFNDAAVDELRGRLGLNPPTNGPTQTGGSVTLPAATAHTAGNGVYQNYDLDTSEPLVSGGKDVTLTFNMQDSHFGSGFITAAAYTYIWQNSTDNVAFNDIVGSGGTFQGQADNYNEDLYPPQFFHDYSLNVTRTYVWTGSTGSAGAPQNYYFRLRVRKDSGSSFNDRVMSATGNEALASAGVVEAHQHLASEITNFDTAVAANSAVAANTAKVTNATHTGDASGATSLTLQPSAITAKTELTTGLAGTDELLVSDAGVLKRMDVSVMNAYFNANLSFAAASHAHSAADITSGTLAVARGGTGTTTSTGTGSVVLSSSPSIASPTFTGSIIQATTNFQDAEVNRPWFRDFSIRHQSYTASTATADIDYTNGQSILLTLTAGVNTTVTITNWPVSGRLGQVQLEIVQAATPVTIIWANTTWLIGGPPDISGASATYLVHLSSRDGGTTVFGTYAADSAAAAGVTSFNARTGAVVPVVGDYSSFFPQKTGTETISGGWTFSAACTVTGAWSFLTSTSTTMRHVNPQTTDTYDLGSSSLLWNQVWATQFEVANQDTTLSRLAAGVLAVEGRALIAHASATYTSSEVTFSTTTPTTEGANGDIWFVYV